MDTKRIRYTFGVVLTAGAMLLAAPAGLAIAKPGNGNGGGCSTNCTSGFYGNGGANGKAKGGLLRFPSTLFPGQTVSNSGNEFSGHISVTNIGSISGHFHPDGRFSGHETGTLP